MERATPDIQKVRFHTLDTMRGVAAIAVMLFHFRHELPSVSGIHLFASGNLAVEMFFVLSGFVIASSYDKRLAEGFSVTRFILNRLIRLLPMVWVGVALGAALLLAQAIPPQLVLGAAFLNGFLLPVPRSPMWPTNPAEWSLFYELIANVTLAAAFPLIHGQRLVAIIVISAVAVVMCTIAAGHIYVKSDWLFVAFGLARVGYSFFLGVLLARTQAIWSPRIPRLPVWIVLAATAAVLCIPETNLQIATDLFSALVLSPALVMLGFKARTSDRSEKWASVIGEISYPLYAIHYPIHDWMKFLCRGFDLPIATVSVLVCMALIPASYLLWRFYDQSMRRTLIGLLLQAERVRSTPAIC